MGIPDIGGFSNEALDAYLDAPIFIQEAKDLKEVADYYDALIALNVPASEAERLFRMSMSREDAEDFFGDRGV